MTGRPTRARQQAELAEGLAVGCIVAGVAAMTTDEQPLEPAFAQAFAPWVWGDRYRSPARGNPPTLVGVLRTSERRRALQIARWTVSRGLFVPQLRDDEWDLAGACRAIEEATGIPARRWVELAARFVDGLDPRLVWRHGPPTTTGAGEGALDLG